MREDLQRLPGIYLISAVSGAQVVSDFSLTVQRATAMGAPELAPGNRDVLQEVSTRSQLFACRNKLSTSNPLQ